MYLYILYVLSRSFFSADHVLWPTLAGAIHDRVNYMSAKVRRGFWHKTKREPRETHSPNQSDYQVRTIRDNNVFQAVHENIL